MNQRNRNRRNGRTPVKRSGNHRAYQPARRRKPNLLPRAIFVFGSFAAIIALAFLVVGEHELATPNEETTPTATPVTAPAVADTTVTEDISEATPAPTEEAEDTEDAGILAEMLFAQEMLDDPMMILVSVNSIMPDGYVVDEVLADSTTGKTLDAEAAYAYMDMSAAASSEGITFYLQSAYRSVSYQEGLFATQIEKWMGWGYSEEEATINAATVVNPPGASEHNCGLAADINCPDFWSLDEGFEDTTAFAWLEEHAVEYGFILRYPKEDQETTGITYEPWHWRYVGAQNAAIIKESGLCLEDFLTELALVANGTSTSDVITGTAAFQTAVYGTL